MKKIIILIILCSGFVHAQLQVGSTLLEQREVVNGLDVPWEIKWGPDDFLWVTERPGIVSRINVETGDKHIILDIEDEVWDSNEAGLLGMEIHPDFNNGAPYVFLAYTYLSGGAKEKIVCYEYDSASDQLINEVVLLDGLDGNSTHIGCRLMALDDLTMLITTGDAQDWEASQDLNSLTGKTLRMSINTFDGTGGDVPVDNPFPGSLVWSWGHRNAQGLAMAPNGTIYSSEHGPSNDDELNLLTVGSNYGWPNVQGYCDNQWVDYYYAGDLNTNYSETEYCDDNNIIDALWSSGSSTIATSDIIWYNHPSIPEFKNTLLMTVLKDKMLVRFEFCEDDQITSYTEFFNNEFGRLRDICVSPNGKIYLANNGYSWPSQGPNEIIELYNPDFDYCDNNDLTCEYSGCMDMEACNYDSIASIEDGSCIYSVLYYDCCSNCINDGDLDMICDELDNCPNIYNPNQEDTDNDGIGDACGETGLDQNWNYRELLYSTDVFGRITGGEKLGFIINLYDDGSIEKEYILK